MGERREMNSVRTPSQVGALTDGYDVMTSISKLAGDLR
jgi:hypothetical protein